MSVTTDTDWRLAASRRTIKKIRTLGLEEYFDTIYWRGKTIPYSGEPRTVANYEAALTASDGQLQEHARAYITNRIAPYVDELEQNAIAKTQLKTEREEAFTAWVSEANPQQIVEYAQRYRDLTLKLRGRIANAEAVLKFLQRSREEQRSAFGRDTWPGIFKMYRSRIAELYEAVTEHEEKMATEIAPLVSKADRLLSRARPYRRDSARLARLYDELATAVKLDKSLPSGSYDAAWYRGRIGYLEGALRTVKQKEAAEREAEREELERERLRIAPFVEQAATLVEQAAALRPYSNKLAGWLDELAYAVRRDRPEVTGEYSETYYADRINIVEKLIPVARTERERRRAEEAAAPQPLETAEAKEPGPGEANPTSSGGPTAETEPDGPAEAAMAGVGTLALLGLAGALAWAWMQQDGAVAAPEED